MQFAVCFCRPRWILWRRLLSAAKTKSLQRTSTSNVLGGAERALALGDRVIGCWRACEKHFYPKASSRREQGWLRRATTWVRQAGPTCGLEQYLTVYLQREPGGATGCKPRAPILVLEMQPALLHVALRNQTGERLVSTGFGGRLVAAARSRRGCSSTRSGEFLEEP